MAAAGGSRVLSTTSWIDYANENSDGE